MSLCITQVVDWGRRWDNMQQHSGQHLLSAVLEKQYDTQVSQEVTQHTRKQQPDNCLLPDSVLVDGGTH